MSLSYALIGLLAVEPRTGYGLTRAFEQDLGRYAWQAGHTSVYPELDRLAKRGLVQITAEGARGSRTWSATAAGRAALRSWLMNPEPGGKVRNEGVLRMFLLSALDPVDALVVLRRIAEQSAASADELRAVRDAAGPAPLTGASGFGQLAAEFGLRQYVAVHEWALWAIAELERGHPHSTHANASNVPPNEAPTSPGSSLGRST